MEAKSEPLMRVPTAVSNPKPKAKDPNKREMSWEEGHELVIGLQSLPPEKIGYAVDILTKRNRNLRDKDEFEVVLRDLDTETVWELDRFVTNYKKIERQALMSHKGVSENDVVPAAASNPKPKAKDPNNREMRQPMETKSEPMQVPAAVSNPNPPISASQLPVRTPLPVRASPVAKPNAKDPNKREMSWEERQELVIGLQSLPPEKLVHVFLILTKRNGNLLQYGVHDMDIDLDALDSETVLWELDQFDDIEIDLDALDSETVWELDRLVTKYSRIS